MPANITSWEWKRLDDASFRPAMSPEERRAAEVEEEMKRVAEKAYEEGLEEGRFEAEQEIRTAVGAARAAAVALDELASRREAECREVPALAVALAEHVLGRELRCDTEVLAEYMRQAVEEIPSQQHVHIRVHPEDLSALAAGRDSDGKEIPVAGSRSVTWVPDPAITRGGCLVEGEDRTVEGRPDRILTRLFEAMTEDGTGGRSDDR